MTDENEVSTGIEEVQREVEEVIERVAVNPKTGKRRTVSSGQPCPNGWQWACDLRAPAPTQQQ